MRLEALESRQLLDAGGAQLIGDVLSVRQNSLPQAVDVLGNDRFDSDYTGQRRITSVSFGSEGGFAQITDDGKSLLYSPPADFEGREQFVYYVDNEHSATASVTVISPLTPDKYQFVADGEQRVLPVLANDRFWLGYQGARKITLVSETTGGADLRISDDGRSLSYTPAEQFSGTDSFIYIVDEIYPARVEIDIPSPLRPDQLETLQNRDAIPLDVLGNDPFWPGYDGPGVITAIIDPDPRATVTISAGGRSLLYQPSPDLHGYDSFSYVVDARFETTVSMSVHRPTRDDHIQVDQNSAGFLVTDLLDNDWYTDIHRQRRTIVNRITSVSGSEQGGFVELSADGRGVRYTPPVDFAGSDTFTYLAEGRYPATVRVSVTRPVRDDVLTVVQDTPNVFLGVLANDFLGNGYQGPKRITAVSASNAGGQLAIDDTVLHGIRYTPPDGFVGSDHFRYTVDGQLEASVTVGVQSLTEYDYERFCSHGQPSVVTLNVLGNDRFSKEYRGPAIITSVTQSENAAVAIGANGKSVEILASRSGNHSFSYTVDNKYESSVTVSILDRLAGDFFVVDQNSSGNSLDVSDNDFERISWRECESRYNGARRISAVNPSINGAEVTVSSDRRSVIYTPPDDFFGRDTFTYVVDGFMQATTNVQVVRRVRDDLVHVDPNSSDNMLKVQVNDGFGTEYTGARQITSVTATAAGGVATVSNDGREIVYSPRQGFLGTDTFTYTVDGALKAEVRVAVNTSTSDQFPKFGSLDQFQKYLVDDALQRYEHLFGQVSHQFFGFGGSFDNAAPTEDLGDAFDNTRSHSETNVQVQGVDEADIIETDSDFLYVLTGRDLVITKAWPADELSVASRVTIEGDPIGEYLRGDRLTVVSRVYESQEPQTEPVTTDDGVRIDSDFIIWPPIPRKELTVVTVFDVTDRFSPKLVQKTRIDGHYVQSRAIQNSVFLVIRNHDVSLPQPKWTPLEDQENQPAGVFDGDFVRWPSVGLGVYETKDEYLARVGQMIEEALPQYSAFTDDQQLVRTGLLHEPESIFRPLDPDARDLISVVVIDADSNQAAIGDTSGVYNTGAGQVYATLEHLYVFDQRWDGNDGVHTNILKFDWSAETGGVDFAAQGAVPGLMLNQFSADEYNGYLRIATNVRNSGFGTWSNRPENDLFVVQDDTGVMEFVGSLQNLALDEKIRSVRYLGDRAFVVTAQTIDPLFGLDLSDPENPRNMGHLTLPGFSNYIQFVDDTHLLTVGRNTPNGIGGPAQVSLFDVSELTRPVLIDQYTFERFSTTEAAIDHHAFGYYGEHEVLAVPSSRTYYRRVDEDGDGYREKRERVDEYQLMVFRIDVNATGRSDLGVELLGTMEHDSRVRRSAYIADKLYSIANDSVQTANVSDPNVVLAEVVIASPDGPAQDEIFVPQRQLVAWDMAGRAKDRLADQDADIDGSGVVTVFAETAKWQIDRQNNVEGFQIVLRAGGDRFLFHTDDSDRVVLVSKEDANPKPRHHAALPHDTNGDGQVSLVDALSVLREYRRQNSSLPAEPDSETHLFWDVNNDGQLSRHDALQVVHRSLPGRIQRMLLVQAAQRPQASLDKQSSEMHEVDAAIIDFGSSSLAE